MRKQFPRISFDFLSLHRINGEQFPVFSRDSYSIICFLMFSFVQNRYYFYAVALGLVVISLVVPFVSKLNLGIDMTGGIQVEYLVEQGSVAAIVAEAKSSVIEKAKQELTETQKKIISDTVVYQISGTNNFIIEAGVAENQALDANGKSDLTALE